MPLALVPHCRADLAFAQRNLLAAKTLEDFVTAAQLAVDIADKAAELAQVRDLITHSAFLIGLGVLSQPLTASARSSQRPFRSISPVIAGGRELPVRHAQG